MVNDLRASESDSTFAKKMKAYIKPPLLIIDELNFLPLGKKGGDYLFQVIDKRYEEGSIILTSNLPFKDWSEIFEDNIKTNAAIERLAHHGEVIVIKGESYRLKEKQKKEIIQGLKDNNKSQDTK
jgi:DNA replication protein DnaC